MELTANNIEYAKQLLIRSVVEPSSPPLIDMEDWDWFQGVALFALSQYAAETGDAQIEAYLQSWFRTHIAKGLPQKNINTMCPVLTLACLAQQSGRKDNLYIIQEWADHLMRHFPRTEEGGFQHLCIDNPNVQQLWADTMFMSVLFLAKAGILLGQKSYIEESVRQFLLHIKYLRDPETGLLFHAWSFLGRHNFGRVRWARGNSWYTAGLVDYLEIAGDCIPNAAQKTLLNALAAQVGTLARLQDASGLWRTVLDDPSSYLETSGSCAFAYGILKAVRLGLLAAEYRECALKAAGALLCKIDARGVVSGVSGGTRVGLDADFYKNIPLGAMPYGQSMALLALVEAGKYIK